MSRLPNTTDAEDRKLIHAAKMAGKKLDRERHLADSPTPIQKALARVPEGAFGRMVRANRHNLDEHKHEREIARRRRQAGIAA